MIALLIATLCNATICAEHVVTDQIPWLTCGSQGQAVVAEWADREGWLLRGYRVDSYRCQVGAHRRNA